MTDMASINLSRAFELLQGWDVVFNRAETPDVPDVLAQTYKEKHDFATGSSYTGTWDALGMSGEGFYKLPHGVTYEGDMLDGEFHGNGLLTYPMGQKIMGTWQQGKLVAWTYQFKDGLDYDENFTYCKCPDRRFYTTIQTSLKPAGKEYLTNDQPTRTIPKSCYDVGEGFYNTNYKCTFSAYQPNKIIRIPNATDEKWVRENCRKEWDEHTGFRPKLYQNWTTGRNQETEQILNGENGQTRI